METDATSKLDSSLSKERLTALRAVTSFGIQAEEFDSEGECGIGVERGCSAWTSGTFKPS